MHGKARFPAPYPLTELERANRVAVNRRSGRLVRSLCPRQLPALVRGRPAGGQRAQPVGKHRGDGSRSGEVMVRADALEGGNGLLAATQDAKAAGIFGSPSFVVDGEFFWGDDRLEDALAGRRRLDNAPPD